MLPKNESVFQSANRHSGLNMQNYMQRLVDLCPAQATPFLLMDRTAIQSRAMDFITQAKSSGVFYAVKANPDPQIVRLIANAGMGFEISASNELDLLLSMGVDVRKIITSNPIKAPEFVEKMYQLGVRRFVFDSVTEAEKIARWAPGSDVIVRLTVENLESSWPLTDKFGIEPKEAAKLLLQSRDLGLNPVGITFHVGSQCEGTLSWNSALERAANVWHSVSLDGVDLEMLNIGGGFPAYYGVDVPSIETIYGIVFKRVAELFPHNIVLEAEPGRSLVADAGALVGSVLGKAGRDGENWLYLDIGVFNGLMEAVGNIPYKFTPLEYHADDYMKWTVAGPSCDSFDVIAKDISLPELAVGDKLFITPGGAYTTAYASSFNGVQIPSVVVV
ncbi:MAG: type III PLP-dependent enzyme [Chloroflexota bacterium]|nr:type III PLP-dependent enzyme [Chloroflexota bacterium]